MTTYLQNKIQNLFKQKTDKIMIKWWKNIMDKIART